MTDAIRVGVNAAYLDASLTATSVKTVPATAIQLDASRAAPAAPRSVWTPAALANPNPGPNELMTYGVPHLVCIRMER